MSNYSRKMKTPKTKEKPLGLIQKMENQAKVSYFNYLKPFIN